MKLFKDFIVLGLVAGFVSSCSCNSCGGDKKSCSSSPTAMEKKSDSTEELSNTLGREGALEEHLQNPENTPHATAETTERWETSWNDASLEKVYPSGQHSAY